MKAKPNQFISRQAVSVWRIKGALFTGILLLVPAGLFVLSYLYQVSWVYFFLGSALYVLLGVWNIVYLPWIRWKIWRYQLHDKEIEVYRGIFIIKHTLIPMARVQHVDTEQGPIYKRFGLTAVMISTAAGTHEIPALTEETGIELRNQIAALAGTEDHGD
ncbi:PH domain-containing protein [Salibacterium aidingense]|uniref:PH domain-containing protein n=1 Tax=Salibacterium aidingense TaxID=384933 RepID=UPI00047C9CB6|nr:PH domain-containing protein [Salibacterium aidingense]